MREFVVYTADEIDAAAKARQLIDSCPEREIQFIADDDPEWNVVRQFAGE